MSAADLTAPPERCGLSHEDALEMRVKNLELWLRYILKDARNPNSNIHWSDPSALYNRGERIKKLTASFESVIREFSSIHGFEDDFAQPILDAAYGLAERMEIAGFKVEKAAARARMYARAAE